METRFTPGIRDYAGLNTDELRGAYLLEGLFVPGEIKLVYTDTDRAIVGGAIPLQGPLMLAAAAELRAEYFCERRELGILNVGGEGSVEVEDHEFAMSKLDCLYVGRGSRKVVLKSRDANDPAAFYLLSYPAHTPCPTRLARKSEATAVELGSAPDANRRTIYKYIHPGGIKSCQLVMGFTQLQDGSVWNTMPPHTHTRRSEIYVYFDLGSNRRVMHFMGTPQETRHIVMADRQVVISPSWSIHCGCGTGAYSFCWGMGGENQTFEDMDPAPLNTLK